MIWLDYPLPPEITKEIVASDPGFVFQGSPGPGGSPVWTGLRLVAETTRAGCAVVKAVASKLSVPMDYVDDVVGRVVKSPLLSRRGVLGPKEDKKLMPLSLIIPGHFFAVFVAVESAVGL